MPAKLAGERLVREAAGLNGMIIRAGLIYGRGGTMLLTSLIGAATRSGTAIHIGAGDNERTPVHVDDPARLYLRALEHRRRAPTTRPDRGSSTSANLPRRSRT